MSSPTPPPSPPSPTQPVQSSAPTLVSSSTTRQSKWPLPVRAYVQRAFASETILPGVNRLEMETKLKEIISTSAKARTLNSIDWEHCLLPQQVLQKEREEAMKSIPIPAIPALFNATLYKSVLKLWFQDLPGTLSAPPPSALLRWFSAPGEARGAFDKECRDVAEAALLSIGLERFPYDPDKLVGLFLAQIALHENEDLAPEEVALALAQLALHENEDLAPEEVALALVLLLDQFPRNIFRDRQGETYAHYDRIALRLSSEFLASGFDTHVRWREAPPWRIWFYLPLVHSEDLADHEMVMGKLRDMRGVMEEKGDGDGVEYVGKVIGFEKRHKDVLDRFGRYPHRNRWLGREDTVEEREYLEGGGETFGT